MNRAKIAVVQPLMIPGGGTEAVTSWTIEALKKDYAVSLISFSQVQTADLNRFYGTELEDSEYSIIRPRLPLFLRKTNRFAMAKDHLMMRYCKSVNREFELFISIGGGMDFGKRGIQYGAYAPASTLMKILGDASAVPKWYYLYKKSFMRLCESFSRFSIASLKSNITLATSRWTGERMEEMYSIRNYEVVYPPVNAPAVNSPWINRQDGFLCIARIVPEKLVDQAVEILKLVRKKGFPVSLHIVGRPDDRRYYKKIQQLAAANTSWVFIHGTLPKDELFRLMDQNKYGINAASDEPAGIAAIEMLKAGCVVFVREGGGLPEIVDTPEVIYSDVHDGAKKIIEVLSSSELQESLRIRLERQSEICSSEKFCRDIQRVVQRFFATGSESLDASSISDANWGNPPGQGV